MPAYAIFGATGLCGGAILSQLLSPPHDPSTTQASGPPNCINLYIRSTAKLASQNPALLSMPNIHIFSGAITSLDTITSCLLTHPPSSSSDTTPTTPAPASTPPILVNTIFLALGANENLPGTRINQDAVHAIVAALTSLKFTHPDMRIPNLIILSSGTLNPHITRGVGTGPLGHALLMRALNHIYADSARAEEFLRLHRSWLTDVTFMTPGGLSDDDVAQGHRLSFDEVAPFVSYKDLAAGFVEVARAEGEGEREMFRWRGVSVMPRKDGASAKMEWRNGMTIVRGLVWNYAPVVAGGLKWLGVF
ncbi:MAG: hypothetical protein OHK93_004636 [Ramalina farinacea]|uniref:NAD(P)-binding domain-containing protein n=1 Tax=Ramalina farinacea TaxID=258253 RepID=A0AA43QUH9_9LECA|nr:hypothetical protein [Ramalina farinacea]